MLKITAIGNLTHDVELKMNEATGKPYAILRIASDRRYKDILIPDAPGKYYLSSAQVEKLLYKSSEGRKAPVSMTQTE